jgi:glucose-1-phosphate thymidylyltransferase
VKGIILAGGKGTRLAPLTSFTSKQLLPVYDKPLIYYPLSTMILAGIKDILIITTSRDQEQFKTLLGSGNNWNIKISYKIQEEPRGLADAFIVGEEFIADDSVCLALGDNIFYGSGLSTLLQEASLLKKGAQVFAYNVSNPKDYGVVEFDSGFKALSLEEKPKSPKSNYAVTGLYFYDNDVVSYAKNLKPSKRGEIEITDLNRIYLEKGDLKVSVLNRGYAWFDTGSHESLLAAQNFISIVQKNQNIQIGSPDEVAFRMNFIGQKELEKIIEPIYKSSYGSYLRTLI